MEKLIGNKKSVAFILVLLLFLFVLYASLPFINAFFGALILFVIFRPAYNYFNLKLKLNKKISAFIVIFISILIILLPFLFIMENLISQLAYVYSQVGDGFQILSFLENYMEKLGLNISNDFIISSLSSFFSFLLSSSFSNLTNIVIGLFLTYVLLYYFLINERTLAEKVIYFIPFNRANSKKIFHKFSDVTNSTIIGSFVVALVQGILVGISFYIVGLPSYFFWGFIAFIASFIPFLGTPIVWIPGAIYLFFIGNTTNAILLVVLGVFISLIDNLIRPFINEKYGNIHPFISLFGIFIGLSQFGFFGIFIGPLLIAYIVLLWQIYEEEYLSEKI